MKFGAFFHDRLVLKQLFSLVGIYFRHQKKLLAGSLVLGFFAETSAMVMPQLTGNLAGSLGSWATFRQAALLFLFVGLGQFFFAVANDVFDRLLKDRLDRDAFCATHEAILSLDPECFKENSGGENLLNINSGRSIAYMLWELISFPVYYGGGMAVGLVLLFRSLRSINLPLWLTVSLVSCMAIQPFLTWYFGKLIAAAFTAVRETSARLNDELLNDLQAPVELRIMNAIKSRLKKMFSIQHRLALQMDKALLLHIASRYTMSLLILLFQFSIVISVLCNYDSRSPVIKDLIAAILLVPMMFNHLNKLQQMYNNVKDQEPYIAAVCKVFQQHRKIPEGCRDFPATGSPEIVLEDISFAYVPGEPVLKKLDMRLRPGMIHAIVAPSGIGKTTVLKLIGRLYAPQSGQIRIAGTDIFSIREDSFRQSCVVCSQTPLFIKGTIRQNFQLQKPDVTDAEIIAICRKTGFSAIAKIDPERIPDFELTLGADNLSGGQRKILALARCLSLRPAVLLLDEPSSGVDGPTIGRYVAPIIRECRGNAAVIVVDHNISLVREVADEVHVLADGMIAESGSPSALLRISNGKFSSLAEKWTTTLHHGSA